jgi:hypothetical protein
VALIISSASDFETVPIGSYLASGFQVATFDQSRKKSVFIFSSMPDKCNKTSKSTPCSTFYNLLKT